MFREIYTARYRDSFGEVTTTIHNNGKKLRMLLRGVEFIGHSLDDWRPDEQADVAQVQQFVFNHEELCGFVLEFDMPLPVLFHSAQLSGTLHVQLTLGVPAPNGGVDRELFFLRMDVLEQSLSSQGKSGWFEDELLDIMRRLPEGMSMQMCFCCAFSDYNPYGNGAFGDLACFRDNREQYLAVKTKHDMLAIWDNYTEYVQETYRCNEFTPRIPGTGYRG